MAVTPMMQQYLNIKQQHKDCILLYRLGDFYEMFFDDAIVASQELEITLTGKECGLAERAPMCGVPYHAVDSYINRLIEKGHHVAICEQMSDPAESKGLVERQVVRIITPGTVIESEMLEEKKNNYLLALLFGDNKAGLSYVDVSTGEMTVLETSSQRQQVLEELARISPTEVLISNKDASWMSENKPPYALEIVSDANFDQKAAVEALRKCTHLSMTALGVRHMELAVRASGALLKYLFDTQKNALAHINTLHVYRRDEHLLLDPVARRNLELTDNLRGRGRKGTLLWLLDRTATSMGGRLLRSWIEQPLSDLAAICRRQDAVEELTQDYILTQSLHDALAPIYDIERLVARISYGTLNARDALALGRSLAALPGLRTLLEQLKSEVMTELYSQLDPMQEVCALLDAAIQPDAPFTIREGGIIRQGYSEELDQLRSASTDGREWINQIEAREREETGIKNLKVGYNKVFGYYIEVTKSYLELVPYRYMRKQTLANCERFITEDLKRVEETILGAQERAVRLEYQLFCQVRDKLAEQIERFQATANAVKRLDALQSLAVVAVENGYCRPEMHDGFDLTIVDGRHPVVEKTLNDPFVPNDTHMDEAGRVMIITGPNMAGKSTYMRQVALITLMAHMGSFVPASQANIPLTDRIFTRVGASDDLASGQSTFMVEMSEMGAILAGATKRSLLILDEIGRGTSTFDGLSIAWATVEYICDPKRIGAKTLFATHYHELSELEGRLEGVVNFCIAVHEHGEEIIFLRKIQRGGADHSFGVQVAGLAGLPQPLISRAREILARLEVNDINQTSIGKNILEDKRKKNAKQINLMEYNAVAFAQEVADLDVQTMTPLDALNLMYTLKEKARTI